MVVNVGRLGTLTYLWIQSFGLSCKDAQDKDVWRLRIKGQLANPALPGKWPLKRCVCVSEVSLGYYCSVAQ